MKVFNPYQQTESEYRRAIAEPAHIQDVSFDQANADFQAYRREHPFAYWQDCFKWRKAALTRNDAARSDVSEVQTLLPKIKGKRKKGRSFVAELNRISS